jgi:hypothetical protein
MEKEAAEASAMRHLKLLAALGIGGYNFYKAFDRQVLRPELYRDMESPETGRHRRHLGFKKLDFLRDPAQFDYAVRNGLIEDDDKNAIPQEYYRDRENFDAMPDTLTHEQVGQHPSALSIGYGTPWKPKAFGGATDPLKMPWYARSEARNIGRMGPLTGLTAGRADKINTSVPGGSHVIPADVVSGIGQGNSNAGHATLGKMFPMSTGPLGMRLNQIHPAKTNFPKLPQVPRQKMSMAGGGHTHRDHVPVKLSDGEFVISPHDVAGIGGGDMEKGHRMLDKFIIHCRKEIIKQMKNLPGPAKD